MSVAGKHGVTASSPKNVLFGAGTYHKGMSFDEATGVLTAGTIIGATSGGGSIEIIGEITTLEFDGAYVKFKGQEVMTGGSAVIKATFTELTPDVAAMAVIGEAKTGTKYTSVTPKSVIEEGDYVDGFGFVGYTADGSKKVIAILESALCTGGLKIDIKSKGQGTVALTMEAHAENAGNLDTIPAKIFFVEE
jgi:hypothetical protein